MNAFSPHPPLLVPSTSRLRVKPVDARFTDAVLVDLLTMRRTATGRALFRRLRNACRVVTIEKPDPPIDPPNAWTRWRDPQTRNATEMVIVYDPANWPNSAPRGAPPSDAVLFGRLLDAAAMAEGAELPDATGDTLSPELTAYLRERAVVPVPSAPPASPRP
jgi:hypothetical protein